MAQLGHAVFLNSVCFSPDGRFVLTGSNDTTARLWETATGKEIRRFEGHAYGVNSVCFSPDSRYVLTGSSDHTARLWNTATGKEIRRFQGHSSWVTAVCFSPNGRAVLTGSVDHTARLWEATTGKEVKRFEGHSGGVYSVCFSPNGRFILGNGNSSVYLWEAATGKQFCSLISFQDGSWAVTDPQGRYDASNEGNLEGLHWVIGNRIVTLNQLRSRYYDPGLLAKYLGYNKAPLRPVQKFTGQDYPPAVAFLRNPADPTRVTVQLTAQGGGIGPVLVRVDGQRLTADARGPQQHAQPDAKSARITLQLPASAHEVEVVAYNKDASWSTEGEPGTRLAWSRAALPTHDPEMYVLAAGIDRYSGGEVQSLRYPAHDAAQVALGRRLGFDKLRGAGHFHLRLLSDDLAPADKALLEAPGDDVQLLAAGKDAFVHALKDIMDRAHSDDILVLFLAGHGTAFQDPASKDVYQQVYCYLTQEANSFDLRNGEVRNACSLTSRSWRPGPMPITSAAAGRY